MLDISVIDQQHKELVGMFNMLHDAVKSRQPREDIYRLIDEIISHTRLHFAAEEQVMQEAGYPMVAEHRQKHRELIQDTLRLRNKLNNVGEELFTEWLDHWPFARVLAHIEYADHQLEDHIFLGDGTAKPTWGPRSG